MCTLAQLLWRRRLIDLVGWFQRPQLVVCAVLRSDNVLRVLLVWWGSQHPEARHTLEIPSTVCGFGFHALPANKSQRLLTNLVQSQHRLPPELDHKFVV